MTGPENVKGMGIVFFWNLRSLFNKFDDFKATIADSKYNIICTTESWLKPNLSDTFILLLNSVYTVLPLSWGLDQG